MNIPEYAEQLIIRFADISLKAPDSPKVREKGRKTPKLKGWREIGVEHVAWLRAQYPDPADTDPTLTEEQKEEVREYNGARSRLANEYRYLKKNLKSILVAQNVLSEFNKVSAMLDGYHALCLEMLRVYAVTRRKQYEVKVEERREDVITVDARPVVEKAYRILTIAKAEVDSGKLNHVNTQLDWKDVSYSLALVTGRRMTEIHYSGVFDVVGPNEIEFWGQLKQGKGGVASYKIPTLVSADLVDAGVKWLEICLRRINEKTAYHTFKITRTGALTIKGELITDHDERIAMCNGRYNSNLNTSEQKEKWPIPGFDGKFNYHLWRSLWLRCALKMLADFGKGPRDLMSGEKARDLLGEATEMEGKYDRWVLTEDCVPYILD